MLSPWLRHRLILELEVIRRVRADYAFSTAEKFIQEVCWRTYWKAWLARHPGVWDDYRRRVRESLAGLEGNADLERRWQQATSGDSGIDCFDHWARELVATGYLHNHARMWFASIWVFTLGLPWPLGADFFLRHLLDGDPASNTLSWRWVAGLQTPGKTYLARPGNIAKYTGERFRPLSGTLAARAEPVEIVQRPAAGPPPKPVPPEPGHRTGWLVTEDDLCGDRPPGWTGPLATVIPLCTTDGRSPLPVSAGVRRFVDEAMADALERLADLGEPVATRTPVSTPEAVIEQAREAGVTQLVTHRVPEGPGRDAVDALVPGLEAAGIRLREGVRPWDETAWPHATAGFFAFWKRFRPALSTLGVGPGGAEAAESASAPDQR